jgi:hypothetical protein
MVTTMVQPLVEFTRMLVISLDLHEF